MEVYHIESETNRMTGLGLDKFDSVPGLVARSGRTCYYHSSFIFGAEFPSSTAAITGL